MNIISLILTKLLEFLIGMGNWGVFFSAIGIFPTEIIISILAAENSSNIPLIALSSSLGELIGAYPVYIIGRLLSEENIYTWLEGKGKFLQVNKNQFDKTKKKISQRSYAYILVSRFIPYLRIVVSLASGFLETNLFLFSLSTFAGTYMYSVAVALLGYKVGGDLESVKMYISKFNTWIALIVLAWILVSIASKYNNRRLKILTKHKKQKKDKA